MEHNDNRSKNNGNCSLPFIFPIQHINLKLCQNTLDRLDKSFQNRQYRQVVNDATTFINQHPELHLIVLYDIRSQANAIQGHYDAAYDDIKKVICRAPDSAVGYLRKGHILSMFGYHRDAIKIYLKGLEKIKSTIIALITKPGVRDEDEEKEQQRKKKEYEEIQRLLIAKKDKSIVINEIAIDFLSSIFPNEIIDKIISQLSVKRKLICLTVSQTWRRKILGCPNTWKRLSFHKDSTDIYPWLLDITPLIGPFVKKLTLGNTNEQTLLKCFEQITQGHFDKIQQLEMTAKSISNLCPLSVNTTVVPAFSQMNISLTHLAVNIGGNKESITLASIIKTCSNLIHIRFSNTTNLWNVVGDFTDIEQQNALTNVELRSAHITGGEIEPLLRKCQHIRRLIMFGCNVSVLSTIDKFAHNLEILGYNCNVEIPGLHKKKNDSEKLHSSGLHYCYNTEQNVNNNMVSHGGHQNTTRKGKLRMISGLFRGHPIHTLRMIQLIYNNRDTLEAIYTPFLALPQEEADKLGATYPDFQLNHPTHIAFSLYPPMDSFLLQSIRYSTVLKCLHVTKLYDLEALSQTLMEMPPLRELSISYVHENCSRNINFDNNNYHTDGTDENVIDSTTALVRRTTTTQGGAENNHLTSLIRLFKRYGETSRMNLPSLRSIKLQYWDVTDGILLSLVNIKTLRKISLTDLTRVTTQGLLNLITLLAEQEDKARLSSIKLCKIEAVSDDVVTTLGDIKSISTIELVHLSSITDKGVKGLIDNPNHHRLSKLKVKNCTQATETCLRYKR